MPMMELRDRQHLYNGFGDGLSRAVEMAVTPALFAGLGLLIDTGLGTWPGFTIGLLVFALCGMFIRVWYAYDAEMAVHEQEAAWRRTGQLPVEPEVGS